MAQKQGTVVTQSKEKQKKTDFFLVIFMLLRNFATI